MTDKINEDDVNYVVCALKGDKPMTDFTPGSYVTQCDVCEAWVVRGSDSPPIGEKYPSLCLPCTVKMAAESGKGNDQVAVTTKTAAIMKKLGLDPEAMGIVIHDPED
jgi:hypothetical protein